MADPYFRPIPIADIAHVERSRPLAGGPLRFADVEVLERGRKPVTIAVDEVPHDALAPLTARRGAWAGLDLRLPRLMGILNVTPDSFSDGGLHESPDPAVAHARQMVLEGADVIDIGGESTRPGSAATPVEDEIARVQPVFERLRALKIETPLSLDTRKSDVAHTVRPEIINDVSGLRHDPHLAKVAAQTGAALIVMHSIGTPETMQTLAPDAYGDVVLDVYDTLRDAVAQAVSAGVAPSRIMIDPGIGFGKTDLQNRALLARLSLFHGLGCPVLLGVSRKGTVGRLTGEANATRRDPGSAGIGLWALSQGIQMLRVHDIVIHKAMLKGWAACRETVQTTRNEGHRA